MNDVNNMNDIWPEHQGSINVNNENLLMIVKDIWDG